jgi:hypothetical protein
MKICLLVIIKNEHEYIDDYVKYHLALGVDHIFFLEDYDSKPHDEVVMKYGDKVTLLKASDIFDNRVNVDHFQNKYTDDCLQLIKKNYDFDWCFVIDIDEYLTLECKGSTLKDIMFQFGWYDSVVLQWENYGSNGLVYKPDYSSKSVTETYTKKTVLKNDIDLTTKLAYNMRKFNENTFQDIHTPKKDTNWCKPDFSKEMKTVVYDKIYIRHYITKSWEEFVNKAYLRGCFTKGYRTLWTYFDLNKDMEEKRPELLEIASKMVGYEI